MDVPSTDEPPSRENRGDTSADQRTDPAKLKEARSRICTAAIAREARVFAQRRSRLGQRRPSVFQIRKPPRIGGVKKPRQAKATPGRMWSGEPRAVVSQSSDVELEALVRPIVRVRGADAERHISKDIALVRS
jgi:hypothetical protein